MSIDLFRNEKSVLFVSLNEIIIILKNLKSFCGKKAFDCAGTRAQGKRFQIL